MSAEQTINPVTDYIKHSVSSGFPSLVKLRFTGPVDWNLNGVWCRDLELLVTPPYASPSDVDVDAAVKALWEYALRPLSFIEPVPYENLSGDEPAVDSAVTAINALRTSVTSHPYFSVHRAEVDGVTVSVELFFKP